MNSCLVGGLGGCGAARNPHHQRRGSGERRMKLTISLFLPALVDRHAASLAFRGPVWPDAVVHRIIPDIIIRNQEYVWVLVF